ncbi:MAG: ATP-binding cassette domain-containing protein [Candidatus Omnitrophica bacterium]|nr:ATP-binding cassette domain-containing protein [Candidatus Omnitrophota bacterium]
MLYSLATMRDFLRLFKFLKPHLGIFILAVVCMFASALFDGFQIAPAIPMIDNVFTGKEITTTKPLPHFLTELIETINSLPRLELLKIIVLVFLTIFTFKGIVEFIRTYLMTNVGQLVLRDVRKALYSKYQYLSLNYYSKSKIGVLVSRITHDVGVINNSITQGLTDIFYQGFKIIILLSLAIFLNWQLFLLSIVLFPFITIPVVRIGRALRKISTKSQEKAAELNSTLYEGISGIRIIKIFSMEEYEINKFAQVNQGYYKILMKSAKRIIIIGPISELVGAAAAMLVLYVGGRQIIQGELSFGMFAAFMGAMFQCVQPFKRLGNISAIMQQASAAATRIFEILDTPQDIQDRPGVTDLAEFKQAIRFEDVSFKYEEAEAEVLKGINLEVPKGTVLAIVGPSGVGKTTLINLVGRFYDATKGKISIDGHGLRDLSLKSLRAKIGIVTQETFLFNDTVKANIAYGDIHASTEAIAQAAGAARVDEFIKKLPKGYDTIIGDRGFRLSGGEKQRLAIARALLKNPPILILDEATSQLDSQSEVLVQQALDKLMQGRTVLVIAHRLSTIRKADTIVVLDAGKIAEHGSHEELLKKGGLYNRLYQLQFK